MRRGVLDEGARLGELQECVTLDLLEGCTLQDLGPYMKSAMKFAKSSRWQASEMNILVKAELAASEEQGEAHEQRAVMWRKRT